MATFLRSPNSPRPARTFYQDESTSRNPTKHTANLSGATMLDLLSGPEGSIAAAYTSSHARNKHSTLKSRQSSHASSTKSQLRQENHTLLEMLQNLQMQLLAQTEAMLDMQSRIAHLERASSQFDINTYEARKARVLNDMRAQINSKEDFTRETNKWWEACQTYAAKSDPPSTATEFFKSPARFSGFNFDFDLLITVPTTPRNTPELDDVPALTPTSDDKNEVTEAFTPGKRRIPPRLMRARTTGMYHDAVSDIREHVVEFDRVKVPAAPVLQTPSRSAKSNLTAWDDEITALPQMPALPLHDEEGRQRGSKGVMRMFSYRGSVRRSKVENESEKSVERRSASSLRCRRLGLSSDYTKQF
jgi:hypothetical protein